MKLLSDADTVAVPAGLSVIGDFFSSIFGAGAWIAATECLNAFGIGYAIGTGMYWVGEKMDETGQGLFPSTDNPFLDSVAGGNMGS